MSTYQIFDRDNDVVENQRTTISSGLWTGGSGTLTASFHTIYKFWTTIQVLTLDVYNEDPNLIRFSRSSICNWICTLRWKWFY